MVQPSAGVEQEHEHRRKPGGRPWPPGVSGNPSGTKNSTRFAALYADMVAEFSDAVLAPSDRALLEQAARLLARRWRDEEVAVKSTNAARHIVNTLHERYKSTSGSPTSPPWSPLRAQMARSQQQADETAA
jgi:hypothetical protein